MQSIDKEGALVLTSAIPMKLKQKYLKKGMLFAFFGVMFLLPGIFVPAKYLSYWGLPSILFCLILITYGLLPYRKIIDMEKNPCRLRIIGNEEITVSWKKQSIRIPFSEIAAINYKDGDNLYGIEIVTTKRPLFFPFFTKTSYKELLSYQMPD